MLFFVKQLYKSHELHVKIDIKKFLQICHFINYNSVEMLHFYEPHTTPY